MTGRQPSEKVSFKPSPSKMQININRKKVPRFSNLAISADLYGRLAPEGSPG